VIEAGSGKRVELFLGDTLHAYTSAGDQGEALLKAALKLWEALRAVEEGH
jgi:hypothetical protein